MTKKELKTVYRIKGLAKEHPANKEFNKFMKRIRRNKNGTKTKTSGRT